MKKPCQRVHVEVPPKRRRIEGVLLCIGGLVPALIVAMGVAVRAEPPVVEDEERVQAVIDQVEKDCRDRTVYMIGRKKAVRLAELVREARPKRVVECGTAIGYSGLWIARELEKAGGGKLITIELDPERAKEAEANFRRAGLEKFVEVRVGDAQEAGWRGGRTDRFPIHRLRLLELPALFPGSPAATQARRRRGGRQRRHRRVEHEALPGPGPVEVHQPHRVVRP